MLRGWFGALLASLTWWRERPPDHGYLRCAECRTVVDGEGLLHQITRSWWSRNEGSGSDRTPMEWTCPACGREGPLAVGEELDNDIIVRCRRRWICRHVFHAPSATATVTCPRCYTAQTPRRRH